MLRTWLYLIFAWSLAGCGGLHQMYSNKNTPLEETALIRPVTNAERNKSLWNPTNVGTGLAGITDLNTPDNERKQVRAEGSYRVLPGKYSVEVTCVAYPVFYSFDVIVIAEAGREYVLDCMGRGRNVRVEVRQAGLPPATPPQ